jgi:hypothetical protein
MAAFKKLNLNHSKISDAIKSYPDVESVIAGKPNWIIRCNGKEVLFLYGSLEMVLQLSTLV